MSDNKSQAKIRCSSCQHEHPFYDSVREEMLPIPYGNVAEGVIVCPNCGRRTHVYYLSPALKQLRDRLDKAAISYQRLPTSFNLARLKEIKAEYAQAYDADQEKYNAIFVIVEKASAVGVSES